MIIADSFGAKTPSYIPREILRRAFGRRGIDVIANGEAGAGGILDRPETRSRRSGSLVGAAAQKGPGRFGCGELSDS